MVTNASWTLEQNSSVIARGSGFTGRFRWDIANQNLVAPFIGFAAPVASNINFGTHGLIYGGQGTVDAFYIANLSNGLDSFGPIVEASPGSPAVGPAWAYTVTPVSVPEPGVRLLFGTGLAAVGMRRYRRKR